MGYYSYLKQEAREAEAEKQAPKRYAEGGSVKNLKATAQELKQMGRYGDDDLVHVNKHEKEMLKMMGGSGDINPRTGLREYVKSTILPPLLRNRKEQLQSFATDFPAQVGNTCSLQNAYHLTNFVKNLPTTTEGSFIGSDILTPEVSAEKTREREADDFRRLCEIIDACEEFGEEDKKEHKGKLFNNCTQRRILEEEKKDYIRDLLNKERDVYTEKTPHKEIEKFTETLLKNPEIFKSSETSTPAFLNAINIKTMALKDYGFEPEDLMEELHAKTTGYRPVIYNGNVKYDQDDQGGGHSLVFLKHKKYTPKEIQTKINKYNEQLEQQQQIERPEPDLNKRKTTKLNSFLKMKQNKLSYRSKIYDPNNSTQGYSEPIFDELLFDESGKGYRTSDLLNTPKPQPFIDLATKPRFTEISGYINKDGVEKPVY